MTNKTELIKRYIFLLVGLFVNGLGVSFITKAGLGTSPITSIPYTLSLDFTPTVGMFTLVFNIFLVILQVILLRRNFQLQNLLQLPIIALFSFFIDLTMSLLGFMQPETYAMKVVSLIVGCLILGFGVFMEMVANVAMLPGEATVRAVSDVFSTDFGKTKIAFDSSMTVIAAILSFIMFKHLDGVREGTIVAAILVGFIARLFKKYIGGIEKILIS
ncbi:MAG: YczE/YyaS/YitT family protein [Hominilimicola sp.]|uniref:YczE/YyaS/YitT family protein n=1 Tax=Hominilimicola sp. TaxID=3073571 RepID=UPI0039996D2C